MVISTSHTDGRGREESVFNLSKRSNTKEALRQQNVVCQNCKVIHNNLQSWQ